MKLRYARQGKTHEASVKAGEIGRVMAFSPDHGLPARPARRWRAASADDDAAAWRGDGNRADRPEARVRARATRNAACPSLYKAFRWQGLNLASIDAGLGRYFGTDKGVLVISSGPRAQGPAVRRRDPRVAGAPVESPRDVMRALRGEGSRQAAEAGRAARSQDRRGDGDGARVASVAVHGTDTGTRRPRRARPRAVRTPAPAAAPAAPRAGAADLDARRRRRRSAKSATWTIRATRTWK